MLRFPPRRILAAVESSAASLHAWKAAWEVAARFGASLEGVWCPAPGERRDALSRLRARLGPGARLHALKGEPSSSILRLARDRRVDLVVMGTHHRPGLVRLVQGSTAEAVVHGAPCPVLVVPGEWREPRWVLAPVHVAPYARRGLTAAAVLARAYKARLTALEVVESGDRGPSAARRVSVQAGKLPPALAKAVRPELEVRVGDPVKEILRAERGRDLIVLVARRKPLFGRLVLGATAERVLRHARLPVLTVPSR